MTGSICVLAEQWRGRVSDVTYEALALGRELADCLAVPLTAILTGSNAKGLAETLGMADSVLYLDHPLLAEPLPQPCAEALAQVLEDRRPRAILAADTINFCKDVKVVDGGLQALCVMYGGKIEAAVRARGEPAILCLWPGARKADQGRSDRLPPVEVATAVLQPSRVRLKRYVDPEAGDMDLTRQEVLVAVGRGIQSRDNVRLAEELAKALGGAVAGSRPVIDQGWLPLSRQVGKSGLTVKPKLYVALGISGAPEHIEGMKDASLIVAVNSDSGAPIFNIAHYGIVADAVDTIPSLTAAIATRRAAAHHA